MGRSEVARGMRPGQSVPAPCPLLIVHLQIVVSLVSGRPGAMNFSCSPLLVTSPKPPTSACASCAPTWHCWATSWARPLRDPTVTRRVSGWASGAAGLGVGGACGRQGCCGRGHGETGLLWAGPQGLRAGVGSLALTLRALHSTITVSRTSAWPAAVCRGHADVCDAKIPTDPFR